MVSNRASSLPQVAASIFREKQIQNLCKNFFWQGKLQQTSAKN
jgi:hypothetical protein